MKSPLLGASVLKLEVSDSGALVQLALPEDSPFFTGHFPEEPILPGIAQLAFVLGAAEIMAGEPLTLAALRSVRFRRPLRPGDTFELSLSPLRASRELDFQLRASGALVASGLIEVASAP